MLCFQLQVNHLYIYKTTSEHSLRGKKHPKSKDGNDCWLEYLKQCIFAASLRINATKWKRPHRVACTLKPRSVNNDVRVQAACYTWCAECLIAATLCDAMEYGSSVYIRVGVCLFVVLFFHFFHLFLSSHWNVHSMRNWN